MVFILTYNTSTLLMLQTDRTKVKTINIGVHELSPFESTSNVNINRPPQLFTPTLNTPILFSSSTFPRLIRLIFTIGFQINQITFN